jgi:hypothetical protein
MRRLLDLAILAALICVSALFFRLTSAVDYYAYDEADYMAAVGRGLAANYLDLGAIPFADFVAQGLQRGTQGENRTALSNYIRERGDIAFLRHYHGPLYFYLQIAGQRLLGPGELAARLTNFAVVPATIVAAYLGCLALRPRAGRAAALIAATLLLISPVNAGVARFITPHGLYALAALAALFCTALLVQTGRRRYWYASVALIAVAFLVIEYALLLLAAFALCVAIYRRTVLAGMDRRAIVRLLASSAALFVGVTLVLWPGAWLQLSLVRNYLFFGYYALFRGGGYGDQSFWEVWAGRVAASPLEYGLLAVGLALALATLRRQPIYAPFLIYAGLMLITTVRNTSPLPTYITSLMAPLYVVAGLAIARALEERLLARAARPQLAAGALAAALAVGLIGYAYGTSISEQRWRTAHTPMRDVITHLRADSFERKRVLVDRGLVPSLSYYFPGAPLESFALASDGMDHVIAALEGGGFDGVLYAGDEQAAFEQALRAHLAVSPERIRRSVVYYELAR